MIYVVSNTLDVKDDRIQKMSVDDSLSLIKTWPVVQFDTETTGLDPHVNKLTCMQFGYKDFSSGTYTQVIVDCNSIDPLLYRQIIESSSLVGHNLKFDLEFLYNYNITPLDVYDTMICEQVLYLGYSAKQVSMNLHDVLLRHTGIDIDKSYQKMIASSGLTLRGILYAAQDVMHLQDIRRGQIEIAKARNCLNAFTVENRFVPAIAYLEWCGIHLDESKWNAKMEKDRARKDELRNKLDEYVQSHTEWNKQFVTSSFQLDLFEPSVCAGSKCTVNWDAPKQVVGVMKSIGFDTKTVDKKTNKEKDTVLETWIINQTGIDDEFIKMYYEYKEASKRVSAYGQNFLDQINPNTGRIHTTFRQLGAVTGRMASGNSSAKNKDLAALKGLPAQAVGYSNMQNLSRDAETRGSFTSIPGNVFISVDYSAEESRVSADVWNEKSLLDAFEKGIDTHNLYAKMCFPDELKDIDVKDVKKLRPDLRQAAKSAEFATNYGSDGSAIAKTLGISVEKAKSMVSGILKGMSGMAAYKKKTADFLKKNGYILINQYTGHRIYWPEWAEWTATAQRFDRQFWTDYTLNHKGTGDEVCEMVKRHRAMEHTWTEKNVLNYPIQGGSAIVMKQAAADFYNWVIRHKLFGKVLFCVFVHDELDIECPESIKDNVSNKLKYYMEKAAGKYYKKIRIPAEVQISDRWLH